MTAVAQMTAAPLQYVDVFSADGVPVPGLVAVNAAPTGLSVAERAATTEAASFGQRDRTGRATHERIDYIFFRRFTDGRPSQIAAYVVDNSDERLDENALSRLHHKLWMHGVAPLLYVAWPARVDILTCARGPDFWDARQNERRYKPAAIIRTAGAIDAELQRRFSVHRLADGTFWEAPENARLARYQKAAHKTLIEGIVETDQDLDGQNQPDQRRLLLLMVLIKYLEDRGVFPKPAWFGRFQKGATRFFDVLSTGNPDAVRQLLEHLEKRFNGDIFRPPGGGRWNLSPTALKRFAKLVEARTLRRQRHLWELHSFEHLPVEVISHLYQRFVKGGRGTVYTPPMLASLLLDHVMPYDELVGTERVLDPACGSGVFLVGALRRLVVAWRARNGWKRPDVKTLKTLLMQSVFGIELEPGAVDLAEFSLALALCDALQSHVIWKDLRFEPLKGTNLLEGDFFSVVLDSQKGRPTLLDSGFDIVIGNPPFESKLTAPGTRVNESVRGKGATLPDKQAAYLFLDQAIAYLRKKGRLCLIQPSGLLYNRKAADFRRTILERIRVDSVFDFTSIRKLFEGADPKSIAISVRNERPSGSAVIDHLTFRRTVSVKERVWFELDHYDRHRVPQGLARSDDPVWRANLLGGGRLLEIIQRLTQTRTLKGFVESQGWLYREGFTVGNRSNPALWLRGMPFLPAEALTEDGIDRNSLDYVQETHFEAPRPQDLYKAPLVLIKENHLLPAAFWPKGEIAFGHEIVGVHAPASQSSGLRDFYETFQRRRPLYQFLTMVTGSRSMVQRATAILKKDIDLLPYPESSKDLELSFWEEAIRGDVTDRLADYVRLGQKSELLQKAADETHMEHYASLFCRMLNTIYPNLKPHSPVWLNGVVCHPFYFGESPEIDWLDDGSVVSELESLVRGPHSGELRTLRVVRFYDANVIFIAKPDRLRYWIPSTAIRDADETLVDLRKQGW